MININLTAINMDKNKSVQDYYKKYTEISDEIRIKTMELEVLRAKQNEAFVLYNKHLKQIEEVRQIKFVSEFHYNHSNTNVPKNMENDVKSLVA